MGVDWHRTEEEKLHRSPCVHNCSLVDGICGGCFRTPDECDRWFSASLEKRRAILERAETRRLRSGGSVAS